jgi:D-alanyl-D-alanine carboxypeptidase
MRRIAVHLGLIAVALACLPAAATASSEPRLQRVLATALARQPVSPGIAAAVYRPGLRWRGAAGVLDRASSLPLRASDGYRIASITKTFTAAAILRLVERGELALRAPVARYLPAGYKRALRAGGYDPSRITVRMLLRHTAGLFDHSADDAYLQALLADPGHRWSRLEQVRFAMEHGEPVAPPGRRYSYSDTGYLLLGQIVESVSGSPQASVYRLLLRLRRLGVDATYFETLEPKPPGAGRQAHQYFGDLDTTEVLDASHDLFGGGGLVSTVSDLNRFYRALFEGRVISRGNLRIMTTPSRQSGRDYYGMGIRRISTAAGTCYGHGGFWGALTVYCPPHKLAISVTVNAASPGSPEVVVRRLAEVATRLAERTPSCSAVASDALRHPQPVLFPQLEHV